MNAAAHPAGGSGGRQAKAAAETMDEKAGGALAARGHHPGSLGRPRAASGMQVGARSLGAQLREQVEPVAELTGLPESVLPEAIEARGGRTGQGA